MSSAERYYLYECAPYKVLMGIEDTIGAAMTRGAWLAQIRLMDRGWLYADALYVAEGGWKKASAHLWSLCTPAGYADVLDRRYIITDVQAELMRSDELDASVLRGGSAP